MCLIFVNPTDSVGGKLFCMDSIWNLKHMYCTGVGVILRLRGVQLTEYSASNKLAV